MAGKTHGNLIDKNEHYRVSESAEKKNTNEKKGKEREKND